VARLRDPIYFAGAGKVPLSPFALVLGTTILGVPGSKQYAQFTIWALAIAVGVELSQRL
jgi:hypothetical protein